jgi:TonB family protein
MRSKLTLITLISGTLLLLLGVTACQEKFEDREEVGADTRKDKRERSFKLRRNANLKLAPYERLMRIIQERVKAKWHPPIDKENLYGQVLFDINKAGEIDKSSLKIRKSSGDDQVDRAMLDTISTLNLKLPLPNMAPDTVTILFNFTPRLMVASPQEDENQLKERLAKINEKLSQHPHPHLQTRPLNEPTRANLLFERSLIYAALKEDDKALADLSQCQLLNYKAEDCCLNKGRILFQRKAFTESLASLKQCRAYNQNNIWATLLTACCYQNLGDLDKADKLLAQAEQLAQAETFPLALAFTLSSKAYGANLRHNYKAAIEASSKAIELDPWHAPAYAYRGDAYDALARAQEALKDYNRALEINGDDLGTYLRRGHLYLEQAHYHKAITDLSEVIKKESDNAQALYFRSCANSQLGLDGQAKSDLLRARKAGWSNPNMVQGN